MSTSVDAPTVDAPSSDGPWLSPIQRLVAVFVQPGRAWSGLRERGQWWIPLLLSLVVMVVTTSLVYQRAFLPTVMDQMQQQVDNGQMPPEQLDRMETFFSGPGGKAIVIGQQAIAIPLLTLLMALGIWVAGGFMLGTKLTYRQSLDVAAWSGLISLPGFILTSLIAFVRNISIRDVHLGLSVLLPQSETPSRLLKGLEAFLDFLGPFAVWSLAVAIIGTAVLSGAPRKSVAWVLSGLYLVMIIFFAALAARFSPGA